VDGLVGEIPEEWQLCETGVVCSTLAPCTQRLVESNRVEQSQPASVTGDLLDRGVMTLVQFYTVKKKGETKQTGGVRGIGL
jgi:hypothetical protein